jgi:tetratricopeptide (TPR) repeat protein
MARFGSLFAVLLLSAASSFGQEFQRSLNRAGFDSSQLVVTAVNSRGEAVGDARVEVLAQGTRSAVASGYTDSSGTVMLSDIPDGRYDVVLTSGVNSTSERVDLEGFTAQITLRIAADGDPTVGGRATVSVAQFKIPDKARKAFNKAQDAFDHHKLDKAQKYVDEALSIEPRFAEALTLRGILKLDAQDENGAIEDLSTAIKADAGYPLAYTALGAAFNRAHRFDEALQTLDRGITIDPASWQNHFEVGKAQVSKGDYAAGLKSMDKAQSLCRGEYPPLHLVKAHALLMTRQYQHAMSELQAFLEKAPKAPQSEKAREMMQQAQALLATAR